MLPKSPKPVASPVCRYVHCTAGEGLMELLQISAQKAVWLTLSSKLIDAELQAFWDIDFKERTACLSLCLIVPILADEAFCLEGESLVFIVYQKPGISLRTDAKLCLEGLVQSLIVFAASGLCEVWFRLNRTALMQLFVFVGSFICT